MTIHCDNFACKNNRDGKCKLDEIQISAARCASYDYGDGVPRGGYADDIEDILFEEYLKGAADETQENRD
ncbi:MAG: hypothetical protein NC299_12925 [Lachnospiraceae bacterium]|nr:hypothetical protein [Ruminococcus sp.]MCM1276241.1 hypothetical protein [Lachnospiraceae bacterium]